MAADLVLIGPPGAGKGTQASMLSARYGMPHIATGDIFRAQADRDTPLGRQVAAVLAHGELVPDALAIDVIRHRLSDPDAQHGFLLDGFPRTVPQAEALDRLLTELARPLDAVLYLQVDAAELAERLAHRALVEQRTDDRPEVVRHRIDVYLEQTAPLIDYYRRQGKLRLIDGSRSPDEVAAASAGVVEALG